MTKRSQAFTLMELLLALTVTTVLVVLLVNVVSAALNVWEQGRSRIDTFANARQVLARIADEIKGATAKGDQMEFLENLTSLKGSTDPQPNISENVFFVAPYPNMGAGDLCVIAYRHNGAGASSSPPPYTLQRAFVDSQNAWNPPASTRYQATGYSTLDWRTVAEGVLDFEIRSYSQEDLDSGNVPQASWDSTSSAPAMAGQAPRRALIRLKVVNDKALVKLKGMSAGTPPFNQLVNTAAREFTADITLSSPH